MQSGGNPVSTRHREWPMFQEPMLPIRLAPTTEVSLRDSDVAAADMQTIEDVPRGKELEPDNNPQAPVLEQPEPPNKANKWQHLGKSATTRAQSKLGNILPPPQFVLFGMQGASAMASRVGVSTILLRPGFSLWLSSYPLGPLCIKMEVEIAYGWMNVEHLARMPIFLSFGDKMISLTCP